MSTASKLHNVVLGAAALPKPRNIILCFDGTGNEFDDTVRFLLHRPPHDFPKLIEMICRRTRTSSDCFPFLG